MAIQVGVAEVSLRLDTREFEEQLNAIRQKVAELQEAIYNLKLASIPASVDEALGKN